MRARQLIWGQVMSRLCWRVGAAVELGQRERRAALNARENPAMHPPPPVLTGSAAQRTCSASSRVGEMMSAPSPSGLLHRARYSFSTTGSRNANVLPARRRVASQTAMCNQLPVAAHAGGCRLFITTAAIPGEVAALSCMGLEERLTHQIQSWRRPAHPDHREHAAALLVAPLSG